MSLKRWLLITTLIFAGILSGCGTSNPPTQYGWCYFYNFATSDYGASIPAGQWQTIDGVRGFTTDETGNLSFGIVHDQPVRPIDVVVTVARASGVTGDIDITANGIIFGVATPNGGFSGTLPDGVPSTDISIVPEGSTDFGSSMNVSVYATNTVQIRGIKVYGNDANPFDVDNCNPVGTPTTTPEIPVSPPPSETATLVPPSETATPGTPTATLSPTPTGWSHTWLYADGSLSDWALVGGGFGGASEGVDTGTSIDLDEFSGFSRLTVSIPIATSGGTAVINSLSITTGTRDVSNGNLKDIEFFGYVAGRSGYSSFGFAARNWDSGSGTTNPWNAPIGVSLTLDGSTAYLALQVNNNASPGTSHFNLTGITMTGTGADPFIDSFETPTPSATPSQTLTPSQTPTATRTNTPPPMTPTRTNTPSRTPTRTPVIVASPLPPTNTAVPSSTSVPSSTAVPTASRTPIPAPTFVSSPTPDLTATPSGGGDPSDDSHGGDILNAIGDFFNWIVNTALNFFDWLGSVFAWINGTLSNIGTLIGNFFQLISGFLALLLALINSIIAIIGLVIAIIAHLLSLIAGWIGQLIARAQMIVNAWFIAAPTPIPFLPHCVSDPTASDVCAFYYVLDNTVLAGSVGGLLIPLITLLLDLAMVFYFIRTVRNLVRKTEEVSA